MLAALDEREHDCRQPGRDERGHEVVDEVARQRREDRQEELAQLVGASRETVNKALADFAARGWLQISARSVLILDVDRLRKRAR